MKGKIRTPLLTAVCTVAVLLLLAVLFREQIRSGIDHARFLSFSRRPNIILITMDTTSIDHLSCYGYERETSPNLDKFAEDGLKFGNAYANSSWTYPSHASLMTGLYPISHGAFYDVKSSTGIYDFTVNRFNDSNVTLAEILQRHGYTTIGVIGGVWLKKRFGLDKGFDIYEDDVRDLTGLTAETINNIVLKHIDQNTKEPFFLFINYFDPHYPYTAPEPFDTRFEKRPLSDIESTEADINKDRKKMPRKDREIFEGKYDGEIAYMDFYLGKFFEYLKEIHAYDESWIIVTADHGESFGEHDYIGHGAALYDNLIHVPLIIKYPKSWTIRNDLEERIQLMDIMPTILSKLNIPVPETCQGQPLGQVKHRIISEVNRNMSDIKKNGDRFNRDQKAIYQGPYKLIWSSNGEDELYDIVEDPRENKNLAGEDPSRVSELTRELEAWYRDVPKSKKSSLGDIDQKTMEQLKALGYLN
jgi:arylsulfatase A-like enzyme